MGNVRSERVKKIAREMLKKHPGKFTADFEENKKMVASLVKTPTIRLRNNIAGYITRLVSQSQPQSEETSQTEGS